MIRKLRVVRSEPRLQHEARCRWCGRLVFMRTDESLHRQAYTYRAMGLHPRTRLVPHSVIHDCLRIAPGRQLLHKGGKP